MPDIKLLNILTISCKTIGTEKEDKDVNCRTNRPSAHDAGCEQYFANTGLERSCTRTNSNAYCYTNTGSNSNLNISNAFIPTVKKCEVKYFLQALAEVTEDQAQVQRDFEDVFNEKGCFNGMISLQIKPESKRYQASPWCIPYALQKPFKEELGRLPQQDTITLLSIDETSEWWNSFVLIPKPNDKVILCLDPARLNQALKNQSIVDLHSMIFSQN